VRGLGGEFDALPPRSPGPLDLQAPPGRAFEPHQPELANGNPQVDMFGTGANHFTAEPPSAPPTPPAGPPGQMSLADLLSHGVEQGPSPGLSLAPEAPAAQDGVPFKINADYMSRQGLLGAREKGPAAPKLIEPSLADGLGAGGPFKGKPMDMSDFAGVKSQGVPEDIVQRSPANSAPDFEKLGQPLVSHDVGPDGSHVFSSPNGTTTAVRLPDGSLKVVDSTTSKAARGTGEGSARIAEAAKFAHSSGHPLVSDTEVSAPEQQVYDALARRGYDVRQNPHSVDKGTKVKKATSDLKGVYEIHPPPLSAAFAR
jgi:hypothetical protein